MFKAIFLFELDYRKNRAVTYVYFTLVFIVSFIVIANPAQRAVGQIYPNAPYVISLWIVILSFIFTVITSAVMGVAVVRDFDHNMESILFCNPLRKIDYLMGRFAGSFITLLFINSAMILGIMGGFALGKIVPWEVAWSEKALLPFNAWHYLQPFLLFNLSNAFIIGSLFFISGALGRNSIIIYTQGVLVIVLYQIGTVFVNDLELQQLAAIADPFGVQSFVYATRYWTPAEQNTMLVSWQGALAYNRILWISAAAVSLVIMHYFFSFNVVRTKKKKGIALELPENIQYRANVPVATSAEQILDTLTYFGQTIRLSLFYFKVIWKEKTFLAIIASGLLLLVVNATKMNTMYGTSSYPTTYAVLNLLNSFSLFLLIVAIFYSGELLWKERTVKFNLILDSMPVPTFVSLLGKFFGLLLVHITLLLLLILCGVIVQTSYGYYKYDFPVYFGTLFTGTLSFLILYTILAFFIQVLVNNKFLGFMLCVLFFLTRIMLNEIGIEHSLLQFGSGTLGVFSDMNRYGHSVIPFTWLNIYWLSFAAILFITAVVFLIRGSEERISVRWKSGKQHFTRAFIIALLSVCLLFIASGFYIYYNTNILNKFEKVSDRQNEQIEYEKTLKKYEHLIQPKIVESNLKAELFPSDRNFEVEGFYYLKNKSNTEIRDIHIQHAHKKLIIDYVKFDREATISEAYKNFGYFIYKLAQPLQPGDSVKLSFKESYITKGFKNADADNEMIYNGTFFNNSWFPSIGYNKHLELADEDARTKGGLKEKNDLLDPDDIKGSNVNLFGDDADHIRFEIVVGTEDDQIAVAPGSLEKEWREKGRHYFKYKMARPMVNFYAIASARYKVKRDHWKDVDLEIYYHPGHEFNIDRMMDAMKESLSYYSKNISPYQYKQLRIVEFPRYAVFAQSFAGTIPFSEGIGFILKVDNPVKDLDMAYYVTAHEVAHQWWGHQVTEAGVKGSGMLSESMSQYEALMMMKHKFPPEMLRRYLKYELDAYLAGRAIERKREESLQLVNDQGYIHYNKGALVFYALQDYIGEDKINEAFRAYNKQWAFSNGPYPTSKDLLHYIEDVTPDSLQYLLHDMFETISLFENKTLQAIYEQKPDGKYQISITVSSEKIKADSVGRESFAGVSDWIDIGVYTKAKNGSEKLIYLKKHKINQKTETFTITTSEKPYSAGIDPLHKLIDRHSDDNTIEATQVVDIGNALAF